MTWRGGLLGEPGTRVIGIGLLYGDIGDGQESGAIKMDLGPVSGGAGLEDECADTELGDRSKGPRLALRASWVSLGLGS